MTRLGLTNTSLSASQAKPHPLRVQPRRMFHPIVWLLLILVAAGGFATAAGKTRWFKDLPWLRGQSAAVEPTESAAMDRTPKNFGRVSALGRLEPLGRLRRVAAPFGSTGAVVERLCVEEGSEVTEGQLLAELDLLPVRVVALEQARTELAVAVARLEQTQAGAKSTEILAAEHLLEQAKSQLQVADRQYARALVMQQKQAISVDAFDQAEWERNRLQLEIKRLEALWESIKEVRPTDLALRKAEVAAAEAKVAMGVQDVEHARIKAPAAGRILKIHTWPGEQLSSNGLLDLGDVSQMVAVAEVYESDLSTIAVGQQATIQVDSSGLVLHGTVQQLGSLVARKVVLTNDPVSDTDARVVEVRILLTPEDSRRVDKLSNARIEAWIETRSTHDADAKIGSSAQALPPQPFGRQG